MNASRLIELKWLPWGVDDGEEVHRAGGGRAGVQGTGGSL